MAPEYFRTVGIPLLAARDFSAGDRRDAPAVVVVDEELARTHWPGESALGKRINPNGPEGAWATVIGVVGHVRSAGPQAAGEPQTENVLIHTPLCMMCGKSAVLSVPNTGWGEWQRGKNIQDALPMLTKEEREMLITGTHPDCFDAMFPPDDDEE